jgi:hypothetical protein
VHDAGTVGAGERQNPVSGRRIDSHGH